MGVQDKVRRVLPLTVDGVGAGGSVLQPVRRWVESQRQLRFQQFRGRAQRSRPRTSVEVVRARSVDRLVGLQVVDVGLSEGLLDSVFCFNGGVVLSLAADTDLDPWVFRADGMSLSLVGRGPDGYRKWLAQLPTINSHVPLDLGGPS